MKGSIKKYTIFLISAFLILSLDFSTKMIVQSRLRLYESISVFEGFLNITLIKNTGVAFGLFSSNPSTVKTAFLIAVTTVSISVILYLVVLLKDGTVFSQISLGMILGGATGNLIDRIRFGAVIDFIDLHYGNIHWPAFNVADAAITVGIILIVWDGFFKKRSQEDTYVSNPF